MEDRAVDVETVQREAVDWVHKLASGRATKAEAAALKHWLQENPLHAEVYAAASRVWKDFGEASRELRLRGEISTGLAYARPSSGRRLTRRATLGALALSGSAAASYAVVRPPFDLWPSFDEWRADFRTQTGRQRQIALSTSVSVHLNTQTSLALRSPGGATDRVELVTGEASFTSSKLSPRSLVVMAASGTTTASGARFDMWRRDASVCVTCLEGNVDVEHHGRKVAIRSGQQVRYDDSALASPVTIDIEQVTAWQQGALIFRMTPLQEVVDEINRYRPGRVILLNAELGQKPVSGRFRIDHMDEILVRLDQAFGAKSRFLPGGLVFMS